MNVGDDKDDEPECYFEEKGRRAVEFRRFACCLSNG